MSATDADWFTQPIEMGRVLTTPYELLPTHEIKVWQGRPPVPTPVRYTRRRSVLAVVKDELPGGLVLLGTVAGVAWTIAQFVGA